jgi:glycolate oxidase FAD binding subunit
MLAPRDAQDLAECLAGARAPVAPVAGGTKRAIGNRVDAEPLSLLAFHGVVDYQPEELVITVRPATTLAALRPVLAAARQRLAFEPPDLAALTGVAGEPTIGGVLAANLSGSRRVTAGAARDHFLGCSAVNGQGERFTAGGRVVKNVTGFDLPRLLAGSWGTLALMTEVTLKAVPAAEAERTLVFAAGAPAEAVRLMTAALASAHEVACAAFDPAPGRVLLRLEGFAASLAARADGLCAMLARDPVEVVDGEASAASWRATGSAQALADAPVIWRLSVPPADAPRVIAALGTQRYLLDWGGGLAWIADDRVDAAAVRGALREGHATLVKAPEEARDRVPVFQPPSPALAALHERIKSAFDPRCVLNPGRLSPGAA